MRGHHYFVFIRQKPLRQFDADGVSLFRRDLAGGEGLDHMITLALTAGLAPAALVVHHVCVGGFPVTVQRSFKAVLLGLIPVHGVVQHRFQRGLFLVLRIIQASVQPVMNDDDLRVCHSKPFPHESRGLPHQPQGLRNFIPGGCAPCVGLMG